MRIFTAPQHTRSILPLTSSDKIIAALRGRYFSFGEPYLESYISRLNAYAKKNRNDTPRKRKTHIIKVRVTAEEKLRIAYACKELHLTQSELVRRVLYGVNVKHTVVVAQGGEDALAALAALSAQCSKVGSNLNQLARHFNSGGKDTEQLRAQILEELSALTNFRLKAEETVGELYGNHQAFDLEKL